MGYYLSVYGSYHLKNKVIYSFFFVSKRIESVSRNSKNHTEHIVASEKCLNHNILFTQQENDKDELYLECGDHLFKFQVRLPDDLPSSFEVNLHFRIIIFQNYTKITVFI